MKKKIDHAFPRETRFVSRRTFAPHTTYSQNTNIYHTVKKGVEPLSLRFSMLIHMLIWVCFFCDAIIETTPTTTHREDGKENHRCMHELYRGGDFFCCCRKRDFHCDRAEKLAGAFLGGWPRKTLKTVLEEKISHASVENCQKMVSFNC